MSTAKLAFHRLIDFTELSIGYNFIETAGINIKAGRSENRVARLSKYTAQQRRKEIGIRKVIGAGVPDIIFLLSKDFLALVALALLIAFPIAGWLLSGWLHSFAYRVPLQASIFVLAGAATVLITLFSIGWQCIKAALVNPINSLRSE